MRISPLSCYNKNMSQKIRAFIALDISEEIRKELTLVQSQLKTKLKDGISWVKPENIHISLRFLGDIRQEDIIKINEIITSLAQETKSFEISLGELGVFANINNPRVIWVGIQKGKDTTKLLQRHLEEKLKTLGFEPERQTFHPHLTLTRIKYLKDKTVLEQCLRIISPDNRLSCLIDKIILFQSTLSPQGSIYTKIFEGNLIH